MKVKTGKLVKHVKMEQGFVEIRENQQYRWMLFDKQVIQTLISKKYPHESTLDHMPVLMNGFNFIENPKRALILGLGGGALIHLINKRHANVHITAVEINKTVILLAQEFFYLSDNLESYSIIHKDAYQYLLETTDSFDLTFIDMYTQGKLPDCYFQESFHRLVSQRLSHEGVAVYNLLCHSKQEIEEIIRLIRLTFQYQTLCIPVHKLRNVILYAFKSNKYKDKVYCLEREKALVKLEYDLTLGLIANLAKISI